MWIRFWLALFLVGVLLGLVVVWSGRVDAAEYNYRVSWNANPPVDRVNRYTVTATSATGDEYVAHVTGDPPETMLTMLIDEPGGTEMRFTAKACRDAVAGIPDDDTAVCSDPSDPPVIVAHPLDAPSTPGGLKVVTVHVTVEVAQ